MTNWGDSTDGLADAPASGSRQSAPVYELPCPTCRAEGSVDSHEWVTWQRERRDLFTQMSAATESVLKQLLHELQARHEQNMPRGPTRVVCGHCGGPGTITTEEGRQLLAFLQRHLHSSTGAAGLRLSGLG